MRECNRTSGAPAIDATGPPARSLQNMLSYADTLAKDVGIAEGVAGLRY